MAKKKEEHNTLRSISYRQNKDPKRSIIIFLILTLLITSIFSIFWDKIVAPDSTVSKEVSLSEIQNMYVKWELDELVIDNNEVRATTKAKTKFYAYRLPTETTKDMGFNNPSIQTKVSVKDIQSWAFWKDLLLSILPIIIIFVIISYALKQSTKGIWWNFGFGKSKARMLDKENVKTVFDDVAGSVESKHELVEIVDFLKNPDKYKKIGASIPRWVLLVWAPWTWKTLLARAVAGEAGVPFFGISWSEFVEMFVWVWASRVRDLFAKAKESSPSIIFIDEIDAIWKQRWWLMTWWGHDEREQTLNQILTEMDWFEPHVNIIILAATNRPEILDKALLRPWRFDRQVVIDKPDIKERIDILKVHVKWKMVSDNIDLEEVAKKTPWFTWADLKNVANEAAIFAARLWKLNVEQSDFMEAIEKVMMWPERRSSVLTQDEKWRTAYHEVGHALSSYFMKESDPVHKISIIARWRSLGSTWYLPKEEKKLYTESKFFAELVSLYWWYIGEKIKYWEVSTWASNDIERATAIARNMVTQYWMSSLWAIQWEQNRSWYYIGTDWEKSAMHSSEFAKKIDEEVIKILTKAIDKTESIIKKHQDVFEELSQTLFEKETILENEFLSMMPKK